MTDPFDISNQEPDLGITTVGVAPTAPDRIGGAQPGALGIVAPLERRIEGSLFSFVNGQLVPVTPFGFTWEWFLLNNDVPGNFQANVTAATLPTIAPDGSVRIITEVRWRAFIVLCAGEPYINNANCRAFVTSDNDPVFRCDFNHNSPTAPIYTDTQNPVVINQYEKAEVGIFTRENASLGILMFLSLDTAGPGATGLAYVALHVYVRGIQIRKPRELGRGSNFNVQANLPVALADRLIFWNTLEQKYRG